MTLAEIKIAALKMMNATTDQLVEENIADYYSDPNLNTYLYAMNESINRCFDRLLMDNVAPRAVVPVDDDLTTTLDDLELNYFIDMTQIADYYKMARVTYTNSNGVYFGDFQFTMEEDTLILPYQSGNGEYRIIYTKTMPYLTGTSVDTDTIVLLGELLRLVPYFIKSELFEEDEPNLAAAARNIFEANLANIKQKTQTRQTVIRSVYDMSE